MVTATSHDVRYRPSRRARAAGATAVLPCACLTCAGGAALPWPHSWPDPPVVNRPRGVKTAVPAGRAPRRLPGFFPVPRP